MQTPRILHLFVSACLLLAVTGCGMKQAMTDAKVGVDDFHTKFNAGKYTDIYAAASPAFRAATTEANLVALLGAVDRKLGKQKSATQTNFRINTHNLTTTAVITMDTRFEQGRGVETFTFLISKGACILQGYNIQSQDMMVK